MLTQSPATYIANETIPAGARVKFVAGSTIAVELADAADVEIGTALLDTGKSSYAAGSEVGVVLTTEAGSRYVILGDTVTVGATLNRDADGKVASDGAGDAFAIALEAGADGKKIEALHLPGLNTGIALADAAVTAAKLANAVADQIATVSAAIANTAVTPDGVAVVTLQLKDAQGNNLAARALLRVWFDDATYGVPTDLGTLTATTGALIKEDTDDALATVVTDATGLAVLALDTAADGTVHVMAAVIGLCATASAAITGNA